MSSENYGDQGVMEITGRVLISTIIALVVVLILVVLFHIYAKWLWHRRQQQQQQQQRRTHDHHAGVTVLRRGLDAAFLKTLPVSQFDSKQFNKKEEGGLECSVCLSELEEGERTRVLPKCNHVFHAECIDMWFHSHSTCPICRNPVAEEETPQLQVVVSVETLLEQNHREDANTNTNINIPTNVLFWGDETEVSTLTSQLVEELATYHQATTLPFQPPATASSSQSNNKDRMVIDIPARERVSEEEDEEEEEERTPIMRSIRRILRSSSRRFNPFSPSGGSASEQVQI